MAALAIRLADTAPMARSIADLAALAQGPGAEAVCLRFPGLFVFDRDGQAVLRRGAAGFLVRPEIRPDEHDRPELVLLPTGQFDALFIELANAAGLGGAINTRGPWPVISRGFDHGHGMTREGVRDHGAR